MRKALSPFEKKLESRVVQKLVHSNTASKQWGQEYALGLVKLMSILQYLCSPQPLNYAAQCEKKKILFHEKVKIGSYK